MRLAGTSTRAPVLGFRPTRGCRCRVRKLPNPRISILSPPRRDFTTLSKIASTMTSESLRVISTTRETSSINSALVILPVFPFSASVHCFLYCHGNGCGLPLVILQASALFVLCHGAQAQPDFLLRFIHFNDLKVVLIAGREGGVPGRAVRHRRGLRFVAQSFYAGREFDEHSERRRAGHAAPYNVAHLMGTKEAFPGVRLQLLHAERQTVVGGVNAEDHGLHHLPLLDHLRGVLHVFGPGKIGYMY